MSDIQRGNGGSRRPTGQQDQSRDQGADRPRDENRGERGEHGNHPGNPRSAAQRFGSRAPRRPAGADLKKHAEFLARVNEENGNHTTITLMDAQQHSLNLGLIILSEKDVDPSGANIVVAHIKILDSASLADKRSVDVQGTGPRSVEVPYLPSEAVDPELIFESKIIPMLAQVHGENCDFVFGGSSVIPRELKPEEENIEAYYAIYQVAAEAIGRTMSLTIGDAELLTIDALRPGTRDEPNPDWVPGTRYLLNINHNPPACITPSGLPVRNDVELVTTEQRPDPTDRSRHEATELCRVSGFLYFEPTEKRRQQYGEQISHALFRPIYRITQIQLNMQQTLEALLFALHTSYAMADPTKWMYNFYQRRGPIARLRDVGAFGYDIPYLLGDDAIEGNKVDTTSSTFNQEKLLWILNTATHVNSFGFQIDIEDAGEFSWQTLFFRCAAEGDRECYKAIYDAAQNLTDGRFGERFHDGDDIVDGADNVIDLGYYYTSGDERRDLRDWTYLETTNYLGDKDRRDIAMAGEFERTFSDVGRDINLRREERHRCYGHLCGDNFRVTGKGVTLNLLPDFMRALYESIQTDGFTITDTSNINDFGATGRRSVDEVDRYGVNLGRNRGGLFSRGRNDDRRRGDDGRTGGAARFTRR